MPDDESTVFDATNAATAVDEPLDGVEAWRGAADAAVGSELAITPLVVPPPDVVAR